jgi:hypothetical protein
LLDTGFHRPALENYTTISDIPSLFLHRAITKEIPADRALEQAAAMITANKVLIKLP